MQSNSAFQSAAAQSGISGELLPAKPAHVVVIGAGFGGLATVQALASSAVSVTVIDRRNFHLFQPLLYQVATAALNPSDIAWPIRSILRGQKNAAVVLGEVIRVDAKSKSIGLRVMVDERLAVPGLENVFVVGDTAAMTSGGKPVPGIAPAAKQAGHYVARLIQRQLKGQSQPAAFRYRHFGSLATIGRHSAVIDWGRVQLTGGLAWLLWGAAHVYFLIGTRYRLLVAWQWVFNYLTYARGARLIAGSDERTGPAA